MKQAGLRSPRELGALFAAQLLVAGVTVAVLMFPHQQSKAQALAEDARLLNELALEFHALHDRWPMRNGGVWELAVNGYIDYKADRNHYHRLYDKFRWNRKNFRFERKR